MGDATVTAGSVAKRYEVLWIESGHEQFAMPDKSFRVEAVGVEIVTSGPVSVLLDDAVLAIARRIYLLADNVEIDLGLAREWPQWGNSPCHLRDPLLLPAGKMIGFRVEGDGLPLRIVLSGRWV